MGIITPFPGVTTTFTTRSLEETIENLPDDPCSAHFYYDAFPYQLAEWSVAKCGPFPEKDQFGYPIAWYGAILINEPDDITGEPRWLYDTNRQTFVVQSGTGTVFCAACLTMLLPATTLYPKVATGFSWSTQDIPDMLACNICGKRISTI